MLKKIILIICLVVLSLGNITNMNVSADCADPGNCIEQADFTIKTTDLFGSSTLYNETDSTEVVINKTLGTIIQNLMIAMGSVALFIMTIGAGYMIFYNGQDDILSKGKSIFNGGLIALAVALTSYYMVAILRFILYKGN